MLQRLLSEHSSERRLAFAVAVGVFIGCSPLYGLHSLIGVGLGLIFRLNKLAVVLGTQVSVPPVLPFLALGSAELGSVVLTGAPLELAWSELQGSDLPRLLADFAAAWAVGGALVGAALGALFYLVTLSFIRRRRRRINDGSSV